MKTHCPLCDSLTCKGVKYHCVFCNKKMKEPAKYCSKHCRVTDANSIKTLIAQLSDLRPTKDDLKNAPKKRKIDSKLIKKLSKLSDIIYKNTIRSKKRRK